MTRFRKLLLVAVCTVPARALFADSAAPPAWADVWPIFQTRCINCHAAHGAAKQLRLDSYQAVLAGSERGAVVLAGNAPESEMIRRLRGQSAPRMPFLSIPLPEEEIDLIARWIDAGLPEVAARD